MRSKSDMNSRPRNSATMGPRQAGPTTSFTHARQSSHTIFVQDLLHFFNDRLQIAGGTRAQFFDLSTPEFSLANAPYSNVVLPSPPAAYTFDGAVSYFFRSSGTQSSCPCRQRVPRTVAVRTVRYIFFQFRKTELCCFGRSES